MRTAGLLRPIRDDELSLMLSWRNAPGVRANMYTRHVISPEEHLAWWARTRQRSDTQYFMHEFDGQPLGIVAFTEIDPSHRRAAWAFYAAPEAPKGTGSRMELLALDHAFTTLGLHKLYCEVLAFNTAVVRMHQKFGFTVEGTFRDQHQMDDQFVDVIRLGLLASEWSAHRSTLSIARTADTQPPLS